MIAYNYKLIICKFLFDSNSSYILKMHLNLLFSNKYWFLFNLFVNVLLIIKWCISYLKPRKNTESKVFIYSNLIPFYKRDNKNLCLQIHKKYLRGKNKYTEPKSWSICQALMYVVTGDYDVFIYNGLLRWKLIFSLKAKCIRKSF